MQSLSLVIAGAVALFLGFGGGGKKDTPDLDGVALFDKSVLAAFGEESCGEKQPKKHPELSVLCDNSWRPLLDEATDKAALVTYRLFRTKVSQQPIFVRIATYPDGSGALWVTTFPKEESTMKAKAKAQVADLSPAELASILPRLEGTPFWTLDHSIPGMKVDKRVQDVPDCSGDAVWILEGKRADDHRAVAVRTCTSGKWMLNVASDIMTLARAKIPGLPAY